MRSVILFAVLLSVCGNVSGQVSAEEYRAEVLAYSHSLKISRAESEAARYEKAKAKTGCLPSLDAAGRFTARFRHTDGVKRWNFAVEPQIIQVIYGGGSVRASYRSASLGYDIALCEEEFTLLDVGYAADYAYWTLSASEIYLASMRRYVGIIRSLKEVVDRRFAEGYIAKGDVLQIETRLSEAEYELTTAERNRAVALHNFNILRGKDSVEETVLADTILDSVALPVRVPFETVVARRPDYAASSLRREQSEAAMRIVRSAYNPQLSAGVNGTWAPYAPNRTGETVIDGAVFVQLSVPIFHWGERHRAVNAARAGIERSESAQRQLYDDILREEINGWTAVTESRSQVEASSRSLRAAGENLSISTYSYGEGVATILDVLQAQLSWLQLYTNSITAHYNYAVAVSAYRRITAR